ncbi:MAG: HisA/HisF-related TIM barrel protein [Gemmatimonadaceae bacterium]
MLVIPQLELKDRRVVRPTRDSGRERQPQERALEVARAWAAAGFHRIHIVDRDAIAGHGSNAMLVDEIVRDCGAEVQVDEAAESRDDIERLVSAGAARVVVGPRWQDEPEWLARVADFYPGLLIADVEVRARRIMRRGWGHHVPLDVLDVVADLRGVPLGGLLISSAPANGHRIGSEMALLEDIAEASEVPVIVDGGVRTVSELRALEYRGVSAVLVGDGWDRGELEPRSLVSEFGES